MRKGFMTRTEAETEEVKQKKVVLSCFKGRTMPKNRVPKKVRQVGESRAVQAIPGRSATDRDTARTPNCEAVRGL